MDFYSYINEGHEPMFKFPYKNVKIFWNTGSTSGEHTMDSRLERIGKTKKEVYDYMKKFINLLKKENKTYGVYAIIFDTFKMIATYSKNRIFVNTFLSKNMTMSHYDFQLQILEAIENFTGQKYEENSFTIVKMLKESISIERGVDYIDIQGMHNSTFEIIEIN